MGWYSRFFAIEPRLFLVVQSGPVPIAESLGEVRIAVAISEKTANIFRSYGISVCVKWMGMTLSSAKSSVS